MYISGENEMNHFHYPLGDLLTGWMLKTLWPKKTKHMPLSIVYLLSDIVWGRGGILVRIRLSLYRSSISQMTTPPTSCLYHMIPATSVKVRVS